MFLFCSRESRDVVGLFEKVTTKEMAWLTGLAFGENWQLRSPLFGGAMRRFWWGIVTQAAGILSLTDPVRKVIDKIHSRRNSKSKLRSAPFEQPSLRLPAHRSRSQTRRRHPFPAAPRDADQVALADSVLPH